MVKKVRKRDIVNSARIISYIGGVLYVLGATLLFLAHFIAAFDLGYYGSRLIIYLFDLTNNLLILAIVGVVIGAGIIILLGAETSHLLTGILLLLLGIAGLGIAAIFPIAGGILFLIAYTRKR
jgi:hypothetical protein